MTGGFGASVGNSTGESAGESIQAGTRRGPPAWKFGTRQIDDHI